MRYSSNSMVDIVVKDWCKFEDLFCKIFLIICDNGQKRLVKFPSIAMLKIGGLPLTYKGVFTYCARAFRWGWVLKAKLLTLLLLGWGLGVGNKMLTVLGEGSSPKLGENGDVILEPSLSWVTRKSAWLWLSELYVQQRREVAKLYQNLIFHHPQTFLGPKKKLWKFGHMSKL